MNYILKIFLFFVLLVSVLILMSTYFINIFFVNEEIINLPKLSPEKTSEKISPIKNKFKNKDIDMQILIEKEEIKKNKRIILKEVEPEPIPFDLNNNTLNSEKTSKDNKKISGNLYKKLKKNSLLNKKLKNENGAEKIDLNKFRVQLGSFKNKNRAKKSYQRFKFKYTQSFSKI